MAAARAAAGSSSSVPHACLLHHVQHEPRRRGVRALDGLGHRHAAAVARDRHDVAGGDAHGLADCARERPLLRSNVVDHVCGADRSNVSPRTKRGRDVVARRAGPVRGQDAEISSRGACTTTTTTTTKRSARWPTGRCCHVRLPYHRMDIHPSIKTLGGSKLGQGEHQNA